MNEPWAGCDFCMAHTVGGDMVARHDSRDAEQTWTTVRTLESHSLCDECFGGTVALVDALAGPNDRRPQGAPMTIAQRLTDNSRCNLCGAMLKNESYSLDLMPALRVSGRRTAHNSMGGIRHVRLCFGCLAWFHSRIYDETGVRGGGIQTTGETCSPWTPDHFTDVYSAFLGPEDTALLKLAVEQAGRVCTPVQPHHARTAAAMGDGLLFIGTNTANRATMLVESLPPEARARVVAVSRLDALGDTSGAVRAGAADFLASPLSAQQVLGTFERVADLRGSPSQRNLRTGLRVLQPSRVRAGEPCQVYRIVVPSSAEPMEAAWLLRRFLRGYDRIGVNEAGALMAHVFCLDADALEVVRRLSYVLGDRARISFEGRLDRESAGRPAGLPKSA